MKQAFWTRSPVLFALVVAIASPAIAQSAGDKAAEARLRKIETEVKALQRQVFPGWQVFPGAGPARTTSRADRDPGQQPGCRPARADGRA